MKNTHLTPQPGLSPSWSANNKQFTGQSNQAILFGLMIPFVMVVLNLVMFGIALPTIRDTFHLQANVVAWLATGYMLPFMISMPLYGRLGDELGKRHLFLVGIATFFTGTIITSTSPTFSWLLFGRAVQGLGAASVVPLSMATISQVFPPDERGKALGTWNSIGPITGIIAPFTAGLLIDYIGWRMIFGPIMLVALVAVWVVRTRVPVKQSQAQSSLLRTFDWGGVILLTLMMTSLTFYLSSQTITGMATLTDWRLLLSAVIFSVIFIVWERRQTQPYVTLSLFLDRTFSRASFCAGVRMFVMSGVSFLTPLYLRDIHNLPAATIGFIVALHSVALLTTMRLGGQLADRWSSRRPVTIGLLVQMVMMIYFARLPDTTALWLLTVGLMLHGLGAGLSLAPLHRASLGRIPREKAGLAAGLYSLVRFTGMVLGPIMVGVVLQYGLDQALLSVVAYQIVFWLIAGVALLGVVAGYGLQE